MKRKRTIHERLDRIEAALVSAKLPKMPHYEILTVDFDKREIQWKGRTIKTEYGQVQFPILESEWPGSAFLRPFNDEEEDGWISG